MRPDATCLSQQHVPGAKRPPCKYSYMKVASYQCAMFDTLKKEAPKKTPRDLMNEGVFTRAELLTGFIYCVKLRVKNPEAVCNNCGQCCKMWADRKHALHPDQPCKGKGTFDNPENPCTKLIDNGDGTFSCEIYGDIMGCPDRLPDGADYDLFEQFLDGTSIGQIKRLMKCPSCVYEFERAI